jgi:hypothetical protein
LTNKLKAVFPFTGANNLPPALAVGYVVTIFSWAVFYVKYIVEDLQEGFQSGEHRDLHLTASVRAET